MPDDQLDGEALEADVTELVDNVETRNEMRKAALGLGQDQAAILLANQVEDIARV